jgi:hypothetical protein
LVSPFVGFEPRADDVDVRIVEAVVLERAALHARDEVFKISAAHVKDGDNVYKFAEHFGLMRVARDAVEHERVAFGMQPSGARQAVREFCQSSMVGSSGTSWPRLEYSTKILPERRFGTQVAEHVAATAMDEAGNRAEDFSMRALARAGRAEHENRAVFQAAFGLKLDFLDLGEWQHDFLMRSVLHHFEVYVAGRNACDALHDKLSTPLVFTSKVMFFSAPCRTTPK